MGWLIIVTRFQLLCLLLAQVLCQLLLLFSHQVVPDSLQPHDCCTPGFPVLHYLPQFAQTHVHLVSDTIQPYHPLSLLFSSCPQSFPASGSFPMSVLFASGGQSTGASASASVPSNEYSGLISFRMDWFDLLAVQGTLKNLLQHHNSNPQFSRLWFVTEMKHFFKKSYLILTDISEFWNKYWASLLFTSIYLLSGSVRICSPIYQDLSRQNDCASAIVGVSY